MVNTRTMNLISRRKLLIGGAMLAALPVLNACGGKDDEPSGEKSSSGASAGAPQGESTKTVQFWSQLAGSKQAAGDELTKALQAKFPDVKLEMDLFGSPSQLNQKLLTALAGGLAPDLIAQAWNFSTAYAGDGQLLALDDLMEKYGLPASALSPQLLAAGQVNGRTYCLPLFGDASLLAVNNKLADAKGLSTEAPPKNWDELREWAKAMTVRDGDKMRTAGMLIYTDAADTWGQFELFLNGNGGSALSEDLTKVTFASDEGIEAFTFLVDLVRKDGVCDVGFATSANLTQEDPFIAGLAGMQIAGTYNLNLANSAELEQGLMLFPGKDGGTASVTDVFSFAIPASSKNADAAFQMIQYALSEEGQESFCGTSQTIPALLAAQNAPKIKSNENLQVFIEALKSAPTQMPVVSQLAEIQDIAGRAMEVAFYGRATPAEALKSAAEEAQALFK